MRVESETVDALVRWPAVVVDAGAPLRTVAQILTEEAIGAALVRRSVFRERTIRHPSGVISERDVSHAVAAGLDPDTTPAGDVMSVDLADARPSDTILRVAERMLAYGVRHVPIGDEEGYVGVISERDVMSALVQEIHEHRRQTRVVDAGGPIEGLVHGAPVTIDENMTLRTVARVLAAEDIGVALVMRAGLMVGIVSERDVTTALADDADPDLVWSADVMTEDLVTARADESIIAVALRLMSEPIRHIVVLGDGGAVGIVSSRDVLCALADDLLASR
jgi:CBS domain-containing protein